MDTNLTKNYSGIIKNLLSYFPSRILIILNFLVIIPLLAYMLDKKEMSIYLIAIQILNLFLTCSFDWISKAVLRFYEKYKIKEKLDEFFSSIFWISIAAYIFIIIFYLLFKDVMLQKYAIPNSTFLYTIALILPCGIRQFLYQLLRLKNQYKLYTISIAIYQIAFVILFLGFFKIIDNANAILLAMLIAISIIDVIIFRNITIDYKLKCTIDYKIIGETLKYALPLIVTNASYWGIFNFSKLIFQNAQHYDSTAIIGIAMSIAEYGLTPFLTLFIFVTFPLIIEKFENNNGLKPYFTNILQLYYIILAPLVSVFCLFPKEIASIFLPESYSSVCLALPFVTLTCFLHEFLKLINLKYHMKNKTYLETIIGIILVSLSFLLNIVLIQKYGILGAAVAMFLTELALIFVNIIIKFKNFDFVALNPVLRTFIKTTILIILVFIAVTFLIPFDNKIVYIIKMFLYLILIYPLCYKLRRRILS